MPQVKLPTVPLFTNDKGPVLPGAHRMKELFDRLNGKRVGLVVNQSSLVGGEHLVDRLISSGLNIKKVFAPEHGFRGNVEAGTKVNSGIDSLTGLPIISLYGKHYKPIPEDLENLDILVFDIQDVGVRFYTYISTLHNVMEACAEQNIPLIVLDRPNPNGFYIDGPVLDTAYKSFVGMHPIPVVYGMTIGELAQMIKGEKWIDKSEQLNLTVFTCQNYQRNKSFSLKVPPSPNLPNDLSILLYPSLCFFEGTVISLGRGTAFPFQVYGHPKLKGPFRFTPSPNKASLNPPLCGVECFGRDLRKCKMSDLLNSKQINLTFLLDAFVQLGSQDSFFLKSNFIDKLYGSDQLRLLLKKRKTSKEIRDSWQPGLQKFKQNRKKYLLYNED